MDTRTDTGKHFLTKRLFTISKMHLKSLTLLASGLTLKMEYVEMACARYKIWVLPEMSTLKCLYLLGSIVNSVFDLFLFKMLLLKSLKKSIPFPCVNEICGVVFLSVEGAWVKIKNKSPLA